MKEKKMLAKKRMVSGHDIPPPAAWLGRRDIHAHHSAVCKRFHTSSGGSAGWGREKDVIHLKRIYISYKDRGGRS